MKIEQEVIVPASVEQVWAFLMDIPSMAACVPGIETFEQRGENDYSARIKQKLGPLSVTFDCRISIVSIDEERYATAARVSGRDTRLGASMKAEMSMQLVQHEGDTRMTMLTDADLSGKIAQYGHGIIKQRASALTEQFGECVSSKVAATTVPGS